MKIKIYNFLSVVTNMRKLGGKIWMDGKILFFMADFGYKSGVWNLYCVVFGWRFLWFYFIGGVGCGIYRKLDSWLITDFL
jgi:hypothetical protein